MDKQLVELDLPVKQIAIVKGKCPIFPLEDFLASACKKCPYRGKNTRCAYALCTYKSAEILVEHTYKKEDEFEEPRFGRFLTPFDTIASTKWSFPCAICQDTVVIKAAGYSILWPGAKAKCHSCKALHTFVKRNRANKKKSLDIDYFFAVSQSRSKGK